MVVDRGPDTAGTGLITTDALEVAGRDGPGTGANTLGRGDLAGTPNFSGSMEDALRLMPEVQFDMAAQRSLQMGEIRPPLISISGGRPYENSYVIDGLGNNNYVTPVTLVNNGNPEQPNYIRTRSQLSLPNATPQGYNLDVELLDNIEIHDSRVPVKYSGFTGGVVAAETRMPETGVFSGRVHWKHSSDDWAEIHFDPASLRGADFDVSFDEARQPRFIRDSFGASLNIPISDRFAGIVSYDRNRTRIPLTYYAGSAAERVGKDQHRDARTWFAKLGGQLDNGMDLELTAVHYDYRGIYHEVNAINSGHDEVQVTSDLALKVSQDAGFGTWTLKAKYADMSSRRDVETNIYKPWRNYGEIDWGGDTSPARWITVPTSPLYGFMLAPGFAVDGNLSAIDLDFGQRTFGSAFDIAFNAFDWGSSRHSVSAGFNSELVWGSLESGGGTVYNGTILALNGPLASGQDGVSYNWSRTGGALYDQYFYTRDVTDAFRTSAATRTLSLWLQDDIEIGRVSLQPGLRLDHDDQFGNYNLAPRLAGSWNVGSRGDLVLHAGVARYYGGPNLHYALYHTLGYTRYTRPGANGVSAEGMLEWTPNTRTFGADYDARDLDTPYSDETSFGLDFSAPGDFVFDYNFVHRRGRDGITKREVRREDGRTETLADNGGRSRYEGHTLSISNQHFENHYFRLAANWSRTRANYADYYSSSGSLLDTTLNRDRSRVIHNGTLMAADLLDMGNFNTPVKVVGFHRTRLFDRLDLSTTATWAGRTPTLVFLGWKPVDDGMNVASYEDYELPSRVTVDMKLGWDIFSSHQQALKLTVDVFNVFNARNAYGRGSYSESVPGQGLVTRYFDYYAPGRSFQAALEYRF